MQSEIKISLVDSFTIRVRLHPDKGLITAVSFEAKMTPSDIARVLNMQKQGAPITLIIGSDQLLFDLDIKSAATEVLEKEGD